MRALWAALAALGLSGLGAAAAPLGAGRAVPASDGAEAAGLSEEMPAMIEPAELAVAPAGTRAVLKKVLDRMESMRAEIAELRAGKLRSDERARRMSERVDGLEVWRDTLAERETEETEEPDDQLPYRNGTTRHRKQAGAAPCGPSSWAARTDAVMAACCPDDASGGGHRRRRAQATTCPLPATCPSAACAAAFVPYYGDCGAELQGHAAELPLPQFAGLYASCQELASGAGEMLQPVAVQMFRVLIDTEGAAQTGGMFPGGGASAGGGDKLDPLQPLPPVPPPPAATAGSGDATTGVTQYNRVCTSADVASCVPECSVEHHGYELLATIDGTDTKFSCNLAHGLYSWMGAASEGGYLGADVQSFFSAVVSGAAGSYLLTLTEDAGIATELVIQPGQDVRISGNFGLAVPSWGTGGFEVQQFGSLSLAGVALAGGLTVQAGGSVTASGGSMGGIVIVAADGTLQLSQVMWQGQTLTLTATQNLQCYQPYITLDDDWRAITNPNPPYSAGGSRNDASCHDSGSHATGVGGGRWYRFMGAGGDALPLSRPNDNRCGTQSTGWLSGWEGAGGTDPPVEYGGQGRYPAAVEGVVEMTVCFDLAGYAPCGGGHVAVNVLRCEDFLLWRLLDVPQCGGAAYCTASSGLFDDGGR